VEFVAQPEKSEAGEYGSISVVDDNGELIDLAVTTNYRVAKVFKELLDTAEDRHDEGFMRRLQETVDKLRTH
jgi:hypothetical protein